jgi:hypothetical protein
MPSGVYERKTETERFSDRYEIVTETGCWIWTAAASKSGYGKFWHDNKDGRAHRASYELHHGKIPDGMQVNHHCDLSLCVNPNHLYLGTQKQNMVDMARRKRTRWAKMNAGSN